MSVTPEDREKVAAGKVVIIGGYSASSKADLDRIEKKLKGTKAAARATPSLPDEKALAKLTDEKLREQATKEGVTPAEGDDNATIVAAILAKRAES